VTAAVRAVGTKAAQPAWTFPVSLERHDRRAELTDEERSALFELGPKPCAAREHGVSHAGPRPTGSR
jgi:hypothetical protein